MMFELLNIIHEIQRERKTLHEQLAEIDRVLLILRPVLGDHKEADNVVPITAGRKRSKMSASARRRISEAQKERWAKIHAAAKRHNRRTA